MQAATSSTINRPSSPLLYSSSISDPGSEVAKAQDSRGEIKDDGTNLNDSVARSSVRASASQA